MRAKFDVEWKEYPTAFDSGAFSHQNRNPGLRIGESLLLQLRAVELLSLESVRIRGGRSLRMMCKLPYWDGDLLLASCFLRRRQVQPNLVVGDGTVCEGTPTVAVAATQ